MEKLLWLFHHVKSGFVKFYAADASLDDAPQSGRPVEVDSDQIETLIENNQQSTLYHTEDRWHTQNIQIKCWKSFALTWLITLMFGFHISEKNLLGHISTCNSLLKHNKASCFLRKFWLAMKSGYCAKIWSGRECGASEMNHHQPHQRPIFIQTRWCCAYGGTGRESSLMSSFQKTKWLIPTSTFN